MNDYCPVCGSRTSMGHQGEPVCPKGHRYNEIKGRGYCFDCKAEFSFIKLSDGCPRCGSDHWSPESRSYRHGEKRRDAP